MAHRQSVAARPFENRLNLSLRLERFYPESGSERSMNAEKWSRVKEIFTLVADLPPGEREAALGAAARGDDDDEIRRSVEKLLAAEDGTGKVSFDGFSVLSPDRSEDFGRAEKIGNYKILKQIGAGGMGAVYLAERADISQRVALKIIRRAAHSDAILRRFRREQEILAALEHPFIARLLDVGVSSAGVPFLTMEYVEGEDLTAYANRRNLSVNERLILFRKVCEAVSYAHTRLVVHRDLKPSNILITKDGEPKLLDFGISKLTSETETAEQTGTVTSLGMLTPNYASPEQFRGETVSTATDVYSLGVILYELLTGALPYDVSNRRIDEAARIVCETAPRRPSDSFTNNRFAENTNRRAKNNTAKFLRGDLDNILLKSLRKEAARRYSSVEQLAEDLRRHLEGLPVTARPDTFSYRAEKFVRRNAVAVGSAALVFFVLIGALLGIYSQYARAERQRVLAESRFNDVRQLANNVVFKYHDEIQNLPGATKARAMLVKDALVYLNRLADEDEASDDSLKIELARAFMKIGDVQGQAYDANLGDTTGAIESYRKAVALLEDAAARNANDLNAQNELATAYQKISALIGRSENEREGFAYAERAVALGERLAAANPLDTEQQLKLAGFYLYLGDASSRENTVENKIEIYRKALQIAEAVYEKEPQNPLAARRIVGLTQRIGARNFELAGTARDGGNEARALEFYRTSQPFFRRSYEMAQKLFAFDAQNAVYRRTLLATKLNLAQARRELGETDEALAAQREGLRELAAAAERDAANVEAKYDLANAYDDAAQTFARRGEFAEASNHFRQAHKLFDAAIEKNPDNREYFISRFNSVLRYGGATAASGDYEQAIKIHQSAFERIKRAPVLQKAGWQAFYEGETLEKVGDAFFGLASAKNASAVERRKYLESARAAYRKAVELWRQSDCWQANFAKDAGKFEFVSRKLADCEEKLTAA